MVGWGDVDINNNAARVLQQIQGPIYDNAYCKRLMMRLGAPQAREQINDSVICVWIPGDKGIIILVTNIKAMDIKYISLFGEFQGIWSGDSGGPLMLPIHQNGTFPVFQIGNFRIE